MNKELIQFIENHLQDNISDISLKYHNKELSFDLREALVQIECRQKTISKLDWFLHHSDFSFPSVQSSEQATHQAVAQFHSNIIGKRKTVLDMTAGLGIDALTLGLGDNTVVAVELDENRAKVLDNNIEALGIKTVNAIWGDSVNILKESEDNRYDWIFVDPARRDSKNKRCFRLQDSQPDVTILQEQLLRVAPDVLIKGSPLLDLTQCVRDLNSIKNLYIVSYRGEVKEVLIHLSRDFKEDNPHIFIADLQQSGPSFPIGEPIYNYVYLIKLRIDSNSLKFASENEIIQDYYVYESGAGVRKLDAVHIAKQYPSLLPLSLQSHIFISEEYIENFPGRVSKIGRKILGKDLKTLKNNKLRIVSRGFPLTADQMRIKYKIREGEEETLFAVRLDDGKGICFIARSLPRV